MLDTRERELRQSPLRYGTCPWLTFRQLRILEALTRSHQTLFIHTLSTRYDQHRHPRSYQRWGTLQGGSRPPPTAQCVLQQVRAWSLSGSNQFTHEFETSKNGPRREHCVASGDSRCSCLALRSSSATPVKHEGLVARGKEVQGPALCSLRQASDSSSAPGPTHHHVYHAGPWQRTAGHRLF